MKRIFLLVMSLSVQFFFAQNTNGQSVLELNNGKVHFKNEQKKPVKIILDTDMLTDPEDMNALCLLNAFADAGEAEILACVVNNYDSNRVSGAAIDAVNSFYHRADIPIGTFKGGNPDVTSPFTLLLHNSFPPNAPNDDKLP